MRSSRPSKYDSMGRGSGMKYVILVCEGMADEPIEELGGRTPLEVAKTPNIAKSTRKFPILRIIKNRIASDFVISPILSFFVLKYK